ncbi:hypothetical protein SAMN05216464_101483 [Mucilaginibacter pineti]|uniref:SxtJ n=1 Tax=Mucilaginibacter pineti TaxID=1391627 RepID=A0A1G6U0H4_9SPHI|nr:SxtJ family membrane protein [Mucilaginibacter pineti]SDD34694.1 hypothetical protein SAMN05216464_101483 [Mucilaginibacter pineti]
MSNLTYKKERRFGLLMGSFILCLCLYKLLRTDSFNYYLSVCGLSLLLPAIVKPKWLVYPRIYWEKLTYYLAIVNTTIWLTLIYIIIFIPLGLLFKLIGRDALAVTSAGNKRSYWQLAEQREQSSLKNQF